MKNITLFLMISALFLLAECKKKDEKSDNFKNLTGVTWKSDSLLVNGANASSGLLAPFVGDVKFNEDGTGTFGSYAGTWSFNNAETQLIIVSSALPINQLTTDIAQLTSTSLKITTLFPNLQNPSVPLNIRMTFKPK
ncbi:MAG TPA: hypothetical protein VK155_15945 [Bacteroidales bacterium]|nr:hypothetical protein [Bacteroidales bacterium]